MKNRFSLGAAFGELKALPIHDVAAAGGWSSVETVQRIYQKSEAKGVLAAIQRVGREP